MGVVLARAGKLAARANQNPPYAPAPGPAPLLPAPFRISANLSTLGSPRAWAATGWAGLTVLRGGPAPLRLAARGQLPPPPTPAKNTSRLRSPAVAAAGSVAPPPPPQLESPELPATSATEPGEPGRAPPLKNTGARSLALHQTMGTPEEPRPPGGGSRGRPTPLLSPRSHPGLNPTAGRAPSPPSRVPRDQGQKPRLLPSLTQKTDAPRPPGLGAPAPLSVPRWRPAAFLDGPYPAISAA